MYRIQSIKQPLLVTSDDGTSSGLVRCLLLGVNLSLSRNRNNSSKIAFMTAAPY